MDRQWYLSRNGQVFGPVTDVQLAQSAAAGRVLPTDLLNVAGQPNWWPATSIPGLLPAPQPEPLSLDPEPLSLDPEPEPVVATRTIRTTCFACFREVSIDIVPGTQTAHCPKCRSAIETGEPAADATPSANQAAFAKLESPTAFKERMQKKAATAQGGSTQDAVVAGLIQGVLRGLANS